MAKSKRNKTIDFSLEDAPAGVLESIKDEHDNLSQLDSIINQTINGDSFKIMQEIPDNFVDLALIDPPYNINKQYDGMNFKKMTDNDYQEYTQKWINLVKPKLKNNASLYVFADWTTSIVIAPYRKNGKAKDWEATASGNFRDTMPSNFWDDISIPYWSMPENTGHPTQKPEKLLAKIILASSNKGDIVFDPFAGAGSSLVTAKKLNRHYVGIEQSRLYTAWGAYRLLKATNDKSIQGYTDGVFWERNTLAAQQAIARKKNAKAKKVDSDKAKSTNAKDGLNDEQNSKEINRNINLF